MGGGEWKPGNSDLGHLDPSESFSKGEGNADDVIQLFNQMITDPDSSPEFKALLFGITGKLLENDKARRMMTVCLNCAYQNINSGVVDGKLIEKMAEEMIKRQEEDFS